MRQMLLVALLVSGFVSVLHETAEAQFCASCRRPHRRGCCATCDMPMAQCTCETTQPVIQTQLRPQQVTTYHDVVETQVRNETVIQNVPVTTYNNVTVDEGGYVWVPKPVTKQVATTVIQQQTATRAVPYQVTRRIPQISTQMVPVQTVQHVTTSVPMTTMAIAPMPMAASTCNTCGGGMTAFAPQYPLPTYGVASIAPAQTMLSPSPIIAPMTAGPVQTMPAINVPLPQTALSPSPLAQPAIDQWQTIPTRSGQLPMRDIDLPNSRSVPTPSDEARELTPRSSRFVPAPSAAIVWNSRAGATR